MSNTLVTWKPDINYAELYMLLNRAESDKNDGVHVILKTKKLDWHDNVLYENDGNYKGNPRIHQFKNGLQSFMFMHEVEMEEADKHSNTDVEYYMDPFMTKEGTVQRIAFYVPTY